MNPFDQPNSTLSATGKTHHQHIMPPTDQPNPTGIPAAPASAPAIESTLTMEMATAALMRGVSIPAVLKHHEGRARMASAIGGIVFGFCIALLCSVQMPRASILGRMFDFRDVQVIVPVSILCVFFWGLFLCYHRWNLVRAAEQVSTHDLATATGILLAHEGVQKLSTRLSNPNVEFNPLLRRIKAVVAQWQLKGGLVEADLVLQQYVADDEESVRRAYSVIRTFVWALPVLGLIGTVLGIAFAVGGFADFLGGKVDDVAVIKKSLVGVTGGLSFAFLLTLLGLATSLVLMLLASGLETREERLFQAVQQRVTGSFLPVLQQVCPVGDKSGDAGIPGEIADPIKIAAEAILNHTANLAETHITKLGELLSAQQQQVIIWGEGLQQQASSAAAVVKDSLEATAKNLRESGSEFLARLELVRETWSKQTEAMQSALQHQSQANQSVSAQLHSAAEQQARASESLAVSLQTMQWALTASAEAVKSLEGGLRKLADSPLERIATDLAKSLDDVSKQSEKVTTTLTELTESTRKTAEVQTNVHEAVKQLHDLKLVETLASFRDSLTRHASLVDKLNKGLTIQLNQ